MMEKILVLEYMEMNSDCTLVHLSIHLLRCKHTLKSSHHFCICLMQELEEAAVGVVEACKRISALLEEKAAELAIIKEEYDTKKKEVRPFHHIWKPEGLHIVCPQGCLRVRWIYLLFYYFIENKQL